MNTKLMTLTLFMGLSISQMPLQAGGINSFITSHATTLQTMVKEHPVYTLLATGSLVGAAYLMYKNAKPKDTSWQESLREDIKNFVNIPELLSSRMIIEESVITIERIGENLSVFYRGKSQLFSYENKTNDQVAQEIIEFIHSRNKWYHKVFNYFGTYKGQ